MSWQTPNLAGRPFLNRQPLYRLSGLLLAVALALSAWNVSTYSRTGSGVATRLTEIARLRGEIATRRQRLATIETDLAQRDLTAENRRVRFLNARIEERAFSWNRLFDRLAEALPRQVRLRSLAPKVVGSRAGAKQAASVRTPVLLTIAGEASDDDALLELVDNLFNHPSFSAPDLKSERRQANDDLTFSLTVVYDPREIPR